MDIRIEQKDDAVNADSYLISRNNHSIHNLSCTGHTFMVSVLLFLQYSKFEERVFNYETRMDKSSYKSAENYLGKGEKATVILAEPRVLGVGRCEQKYHKIPSQGINMPFTFDS